MNPFVDQKIRIAGRTDRGRHRSDNEDALLIDVEMGLMMVADGVGGHAGGEVASQAVVALTHQHLKKAFLTNHVPVFHPIPPTPSLDPRTIRLGNCIKLSHEWISEMGRNDPTKKNMGTTLVVAYAWEDRVSIAHVGDSRAYLYRQGQLIQQTEDHSFVQNQINRGLMAPEDAEKSIYRNTLTRCIGMGDDVTVDLKEMVLETDDTILLCSDGLTKMLDDEQIRAALQQMTKPAAAVDLLIRRANEAGGRDNTTVIIGQVTRGENPR